MGQIIGERPTELIDGILRMAGQGLPGEEFAKLVDALCAAAHGTRFEHWLNSRRLRVESPFGNRIPAVMPTPPPASFVDPGKKVFGCPHYSRACFVLAPCCRGWFECRHCHDEARGLNGCCGEMDRHLVTTLSCMRCGTPQPLGTRCARCNEPFARHACVDCALFDDHPARALFHCPFCNVCRVGRGLGLDYKHCMECNACISLEDWDTHVCMRSSVENNCAICCGDLKASTMQLQTLCQSGAFVYCR